MGREIKRVPLDFDWPLGMAWKGYISPYSSQKCKPCDGSGQNPETKQIADDWYDFDRTGRRWCNNITQDEVEALVERDRLYDLTRSFVPGQGWVKNDPPYMPTAAEVNKWSRDGLGHDAINSWICIETRARRLGVWGKCRYCGGDGSIWFNETIKELADKWYEDERYDPPEGDGWQLWKTVSEGSPISPVFATKEEFGDWLYGEGYSPEAIAAFIEAGWSPSMAGFAGNIKPAIECLVQD